HAGKIAAADLGKRTAGAKYPAADSPGWNPEDAGAGDDTIREGLGQHRAGDCVLVAGQPAHRQADVLLLRERGVLLIAEALTGPADDRTAVRYGNPHLRDADCDGGAAGRLSGACGFGCSQLADRIKLENRAGPHARCRSHSVLDRNDDLRTAAVVGGARVSRTAAVSKGLRLAPAGCGGVEFRIRASL